MYLPAMYHSSGENFALFALSCQSFWKLKFLLYRFSVRLFSRKGLDGMREVKLRVNADSSKSTVVEVEDVAPKVAGKMIGSSLWVVVSVRVEGR